MHTKNTAKTAITLTILILTITPILITEAASLTITETADYNQFVHTNINTENGNITYLDKPAFPVTINNTQISVGESWIISCPLQADHSYHVYLYGKWADTEATATAKTDYDIYVYNPSRTLESAHTEAAGVIEEVNSDADGHLFTPKQTGNYTFEIKNDARESQDAEQATFMIIEDVNCNQWHTAPMKGKNEDSLSNPETIQAYEFTTTNQSRLEVYVNIPDSLDMYEARLYLMNDQSSPTVNGFPLPTEEGLVGNGTNGVGGYNFDTQGSRGVAYAGCDRKGEDILLTYKPPAAGGTRLYQLVLIAEEGQGNVEFMVKTDFSNNTLTPVRALGKVYPQAPAALSFKTSGGSLEEANLTYTTDGWATLDWIPMAVSNTTCDATIPGQKAGVTVQYRVDAVDILKNMISTSGSYTVKVQPTLKLVLDEDTGMVGQNITFRGTLSPSDGNSVVNVQFFTSNDTQVVTCDVRSNGSFTGEFAPTAAGDWGVLANAPETGTSFACDSSQFIISVVEPPIYVKYGLYIGIGLVAAVAAGGAVYFLKFRNK